MEIIVKGKGRVTLNKNKFISSGGEGSIYAIQQTAYKIYTNAKNMIPYDKIKELSLIKDKNVIIPKNIITNKKNKPIGYTMKYLSNNYALCQLFTKAFRDRNNLTAEMMLKLIQIMQNTIQNIHNQNILIVDINEMNFLVEKNFSKIYFIDTDSYQTPSFPATALMESIRDRHSSTFNQNTDWFSFGIVSFMMFVGIHPFKGKHAKFKSLDDRMINNIPVFNKDVSYPKTCQSFDIIPQIYKNWYKAIFSGQKRLPPPFDAHPVITIVAQYHKIKSNADFEIQELMTFDKYENIIKYLNIDGTQIIITNKNFWQNKNSWVRTANSHIAITPQMNNLICATLDNKNNLKMYDIKTQKEINCDIKAEEIMSYNGRILIKNKDNLSEINFVEIPNNLYATSHHLCKVMQKATQMYDGIIIQNIIGMCVVSISPEKNTCHQVTLPELKGYKIIDAKYDNNILMIIGHKKGKYDKLIITFYDNFSNYMIRTIKDISYNGINFIVLDNNVVIHINELDKLEIFSNDIDIKDLKVIKNNAINGSMKLFRNGIKVLFSQNNILYKIKMKG